MSRRRLRTRLLTAILSPLVFIALIEAGLRVAGFRYGTAAVEHTEETRRLPENIYARHPTLLWTLPPNALIDHPKACFPHVRTNHLGLRGSPPPEDRQPGELRVLCLGDSVTFGFGVRDEETWPAQLSTFLGATGRPVHVVNGAIPGWSSVQGLRLFEMLQGYDPDVVVFWFGMNDVLPAWGRPDAAKGGDPGLLDRAAWALSNLRTMQAATRIRDGFLDSDAAPTRASVEDFRSAVEHLRAVEAAGGPRVIFIRYPECIETTSRQLARVVAQADDLGVSWVSGPRSLLLPITPAPDSVLPTGRLVPGTNGSELRFGRADGPPRALDDIRRDLADTRAWTIGLNRRMALLGPDAPTAAALFHGAPRSAVFSDNCHLTPEGCRRVARAIGRMILADPPKRR